MAVYRYALDAATLEAAVKAVSPKVTAVKKQWTKIIVETNATLTAGEKILIRNAIRNTQEALIEEP